MDKKMNGVALPSNSASGATSTRFASQALRPNYGSRDVQEALVHLASIDLLELCNEAKVERCRATRDLRSCGRDVQYVLSSCKHASLCAECSQRCDMCPICRTPIPKTKDKQQRRLYNECVEAGLIPKRCEERSQEIESGEKEPIADVQRLYSFFDVALENNLVSLIRLYVTDVCMDEGAVSSDPVTAFLLDEVVVKDWCNRTFRNILKGLKGIYNLGVEGMKSRLNLLFKFSVLLAGISNVLEILESSFKNSLSAQLHDLQHLQECVLKAKQHLEIMVWCIRHQFLENVRSRYSNFASWRSVVRERKSAAIRRSWPDALDDSIESSGLSGSLFIEDALGNLELEQMPPLEMQEELELTFLQQDGASSILRSKMEGVAGSYPFESIRAAVDVLFLCGSSDMVVAKQAILLYYLFDRHWTMPDGSWRDIVEDFAAAFSITRHSILESFIFYLLDDHTDEALKEACNLLPEISSPTTHPKICQVLLERKNPEMALMVLRWSGHDFGSSPVSLGEAVTAVRVRVECGLLTEAFMYQRMICTKVKENKMHGGCSNASDDTKSKYRGWGDWMKILVNEICYLCVRRNFVDKMIELPWNSDEEKYLDNCLLECSTAQLPTPVGSLLFVFYLQRYRYGEAYRVHLTLQNVEQDFISNNNVDAEVLSRMRATSQWREGLVNKFMELLPEAQQLQVKAGKLPDIGAISVEVERPEISNPHEVQEQNSTGLFLPSSNSTSLTLLKPSISETPGIQGGSSNHRHSLLNKTYGSRSVLPRTPFIVAERGLKPQDSISKSLKFEDALTPIHRENPVKTPSFQEISRTSLRNFQRSHLLDSNSSKLSQSVEQGRIFGPHLTASPYSRENGTSKGAQLDTDSNMFISDDLMDVSWSNHGGKNSSGLEEKNMNGGLRWRSDETSDEEEESVHHTTQRTNRRTRFVKR